MSRSGTDPNQGLRQCDNDPTESSPKGPRKSFVNRHDILRCLDAGIPAEAVADLCGYRLQPKDIRPVSRSKKARDATVKAQPLPLSIPTTRSLSFHRATIAGVRKEGFESAQDAVTSFKPCSDKELSVRFGPPSIEPLMPLSRLWPYLHGVLGHHRSGRRLDLRLATRLAALGGPLFRLPCHPVLRWTPHAQIIVDQSLPVGFIDDDIEIVRKELRRLRGLSGLSVKTVEGKTIEACDIDMVPTLVLSDLGQLRRTANLIEAWIKLGLRLRRAGILPVALVPCPRDRWVARITSVWNCACWDRHARLPLPGKGLDPVVDSQSGMQAEQRMHKLLSLLSSSVLIEPALLRAIRCILPEDQADIGSEFDVRTIPATEVAGRDLAIVSRERQAYAASFRAIKSPSLKQKVMDVMRNHHTGYSPWIYWREVLNLYEAGVPIPPEDLREAQEGQIRINDTMLRDIDQPDQAERTGLFPTRRWEMAHLSSSARGDYYAACAWALTCRYYRCKEMEIPEGMNGEDVQAAMRMTLPDPGRATRWLIRREHKGDGTFVLQIRPWSMHVPARVPDILSGTPWAVLYVRRGHLTVIVDRGDMQDRCSLLLTPGETHEIPLPKYDSVVLRSDCGHVQIGEQPTPPWATKYGWDQYGLFAQFTVAGVVFDLRWIPPGTFMMGSPEDEAGRWDAEGPQHRVTIGTGFWLGETPVTQGQYAAVTGKRPSRFEHAGDLAPVEQLSWEDCQALCKALKGKVDELSDELEFRLPSEAQWEYACRAGTTTALYTGPLTIKGERDGPELDAIAWYGGNSGVDYEGGYDSSDWKEKQYQHDRAGTHPVGQKKPNPWGLYDMLGNVWEWCEDQWHDNYKDAPIDGRAWIEKEKGGLCVCRGGGWLNYARCCRCAYRDYWDPDYRDNDLGFRLVLAPRSSQG